MTSYWLESKHASVNIGSVLFLMTNIEVILNYSSCSTEPVIDGSLHFITFVHWVWFWQVWLDGKSISCSRYKRQLWVSVWKASQRWCVHTVFTKKSYSIILLSDMPVTANDVQKPEVAVNLSQQRNTEKMFVLKKPRSAVDRCSNCNMFVVHCTHVIWKILCCRKVIGSLVPFFVTGYSLILYLTAVLAHVVSHGI